MKRIYLFTLVTLIFTLSACGGSAAPTDEMSQPVSDDDSMPAPQSASYIPSPADSKLTRGAVFIDSTDLLIMESFPLQFSLKLAGNLPTPCNQLRIAVSPPDANNKIVADVYSVSDPAILCAEMLQPFDINFPLGSFPAGHYTIWINGEQVGEFDA